MHHKIYLEEKYREYPDGCVHAEGAKGRHLRGGPDPECHEVCERGDGDRHPRVLHRPAQPLRHAPGSAEIHNVVVYFTNLMFFRR